MLKSLEAAGAYRCLFKQADALDDAESYADTASMGLWGTSLVAGATVAGAPIAAVTGPAAAAAGLIGGGLGTINALRRGNFGEAAVLGLTTPLMASGLGKPLKSMLLKPGIRAASKYLGPAAGKAVSRTARSAFQAGRRIHKTVPKMIGKYSPRSGRMAGSAIRFGMRNPMLAGFGLPMAANMLGIGGGGGESGQGGTTEGYQTNRIGLGTDESEIKNIAPGLSQTQINMPLLQQGQNQQQISPAVPLPQTQPQEQE